MDVCTITPSGGMVRTKVPTNATDQSIGVWEGIQKVRQMLKKEHGWEGRFDYVHHGTTTGTNAILEGIGAKTGLVVTAGHKDVLTVRRSNNPSGLGGWINYAQPELIVLLERAVEAAERVTIVGDIFKELDEKAFHKSLTVPKRQQPEAISVSLLNSFANNSHETRIKEILQEEFGPKVEVVTSTEVLSEIQEYDRTVTTTAMPNIHCSAFCVG